MIDFLEYLKEVSPNFVAEAKKDGGNPFAKKDGGDDKGCEDKGGDKGPSMFEKFAKKKEGGEDKGGDDKGGKPEFPANFLKNAKKK